MSTSLAIGPARAKQIRALKGILVLAILAISMSVSAVARAAVPQPPQPSLGGTLILSVEAVPIVTVAKPGFSPAQLQPGGGGTSPGCWRGVTRGGDNTGTGHYWQYYLFSWCSNYSGAITNLYDEQTYPDIGGWYAYEGFDGVRTVGGCLGCSYLTRDAQGRFAWTAPFLGSLSHGTAIDSVEIHAGGYMVAGPDERRW